MLKPESSGHSPQLKGGYAPPFAALLE